MNSAITTMVIEVFIWFPSFGWWNGDGSTHEAGFNLFPDSNQVFREFRKLLSLRRASHSMALYYRQTA